MLPLELLLIVGYQTGVEAVLEQIRGCPLDRSPGPLTKSARPCSTGVRGFTKDGANSGRALPGGGSPRRSTLPLGNSGRASRNTKARVGDILIIAPRWEVGTL